MMHYNTFIYWLFIYLFLWIKCLFVLSFLRLLLCFSCWDDMSSWSGCFLLSCRFVLFCSLVFTFHLQDKTRSTRCCEISGMTSSNRQFIKCPTGEENISWTPQEPSPGCCLWTERRNLSQTPGPSGYFLFSLSTNSCTYSHRSMKLLKFMDNTALVGSSLVEESSYRWETDHLESWSRRSHNLNHSLWFRVSLSNRFDGVLIIKLFHCQQTPKVKLNSSSGMDEEIREDQREIKMKWKDGGIVLDLV